LHDVIIVGGGPAGCEAAWHCAVHGLDTLLLTTSLDSLYWPAGGSAQLDAAAGSLAEVILAGQETGGREAPLRARDLHARAKEALEGLTALHLLQSNVSGLLVAQAEPGVKGVQTWEGLEHEAKLVALCVGSFLQGRVSAGQLQETAGRLGEMAYDDLYLQLLQLGFSFELESVEAESEYPYLQQSRIFAATEFAPGHGFALQRFANLFAAGFCASGYLSFADAALQGLKLGRSLVTAAS
jgi:tRNA U34 5-carboxymethylaminomethyl modifying enzyme MnmG/GidA